MDRLTVFLSGHEDLFMALSAISLAVFVVSLAAVPWLIGRMDPEYFVQEPGQARRPDPGRPMTFAAAG